MFIRQVWGQDRRICSLKLEFKGVINWIGDTNGPAMEGHYMNR